MSDNVIENEVLPRLRAMVDIWRLADEGEITVSEARNATAILVQRIERKLRLSEDA